MALQNTLNIITLNVRGMGAYNKCKHLYSYFREHKADIILLQETHCTEKTAKNWEIEWGGKMFHSYGESNARGTAILLSKAMTRKTEKPVVTTDNQGRWVMAELEINNAKYVIVNIYGPNRDVPGFYNEASNILANTSAEYIIVGGDFNLVLDPELDSKNRPDSQPKACQALQEMMDRHSLVDIWRVLNPDMTDFTWYKLHPSPTFSRLDMFLVNAGLVTCVEEIHKLSRVKTDHFGVLLKLRTDQYERGPGTWKFNNTHLDNSDFVKIMQECIQQAQNDGSQLNPDEKWEFLKHQMIERCKKYAKAVARRKNETKENLIQTLQILHMDMVVDPNNDDILHAIQRIESDLDDIRQEKINSSIFRSKTNWELHGERPSKYFFGLKKCNFLNKNMHAVINKKGHICKQQSDILKEQVRFYSKLYTKNSQVHFDLKPSAQECILTELEKQKLDTELTINKLENALDGMKNDKTPGIDGLTKEFYKKFFMLLGPPLHEMYTHAFHSGTLCASAKKGLLTLIPKKDRNLLHLKAW